MDYAYQYKKIDAFTANGSLGNPAACLYLKANQSLTPQQMLEIARQHQGFVSEVVYGKQDASGIHLTYYSSECEVDFCGHGTIAYLYCLVKDQPALWAKKELRIHTNKKGALTVYNRIPEQDAILITAPQPIYLGTQIKAVTVAQNLGIESSAIATTLPFDLIDAGLRTLIVPIAGLAAEISFFPEEQRLKQFCIANGIDIILTFSQEVAEPGHIAHTRVFAPKFGYLEDPATGSGNSALGYYMLKHKLWNGQDCTVEQGGSDRKYNNIHLAYLNNTVLFGGSATVRIDGIYYC